MSSSLHFTFTNGRTARAVRVKEKAELSAALDSLGLQHPAPVLVMIGGASNLSVDDYQRLENLFTHLLAPLAEALGMVVVDGGTDAGIMQLMGLARTKIGASFPLVGIAPVGKVEIPGQSSRSEASTFTSVDQPTIHPLEPHHSHFLLVPGTKWGDESSWIAETASLVSQNAPSITILMNGGNVSLKDVQQSIAEERTVLVIAGTGRLADQIATALQNPQAEVQEALASVLKTGCFRLFGLSDSKSRLKTFLEQYFLQNSVYPTANLPSY